MNGANTTGLLRFWPILAVVITLGLHVAIAAVYEMPGNFRKYTFAAELHLAGELPSDRLTDLSPFYFQLATVAARLTSDPDQILTWLQLLLVALSAGFLAELYQRRFGILWSMVGVLVFILDRQLLVYQRILEPEACLLFFVLGWIFFVERSLFALRQAEPRRGEPFLLIAGLLAGASLLTRPTFLPLLLTVPFYLAWRQPGSWRRPSLIFSGPIAVALLLSALHAAVVTGDPRTPVMNPGTVFYEGNQPHSRGTSAIYPATVRLLMNAEESRPDIAHEHYRTVARAATGKNLSVAEVNAYWSGLALDYIWAEPRRFFALERDKLIRIFHSYRWHDISSAWRLDQNLRIPHLPLAILSALTLVGLLFEAKRLRRAFLFYGLAGLQMAVMLVFYVSARQRLVLLPALIYFALAGLDGIYHQRQRRGRVIGLVLGVLLLALCFTLPNDASLDDHRVKEGTAMAQDLLADLQRVTRTEPMAAHTELALDALRHAPWISWTPAYFPQQDRGIEAALLQSLENGSLENGSRFDLGVLLLRADRLADAARVLEELVAEEREVYRGSRQASLPRYYLARVEMRRGNREQALRWLEEALDRSPGNAFVLADLIALTDDPRHQQELTVGTSVLDAQYLLGEALLFHGRADEAVAAFQFVVDRLPQFRTGRISLAVALGAAGQVDEGAAQYLEAVKTAPDPLILSQRVSDLFRQWAMLHSEDPKVRFFSARVLHEHGHFREALALLEAITPAPSLEAAHDEEIRRLRLVSSLVP